MTALHKGMMVSFYPAGDMSYDNARPAIVVDHSPCNMIATLKVIRFGTDLFKQHVKRHDHPAFEQFPQHKFEQGVWAELAMPPMPAVKEDTRKGSRTTTVTADIASKVKQLADGGMSPTAIVGRLKDSSITLPQVQEILGAK
jgi:deferrochelatase/peroxidase EfeB